MNPETDKFIPNISPRESTPVKEFNTIVNSTIKDYQYLNKNNNLIVRKNSNKNSNQINELLNSNNKDKKDKFLYNILNNVNKPSEAEFKILSSRLNRKGSAIPSIVGQEKDSKLKNENEINSLKNSKTKKNNNLFNSSQASLKFSLTNRNNSKNNFNTVNNSRNKDYNSNNVEKLIKKNVKNFENLIVNSKNIENNAGKDKGGIKPKIKGIQIKNFNQVLQNSIPLKGCYSNSDRTNKNNNNNVFN